MYSFRQATVRNLYLQRTTGTSLWKKLYCGFSTTSEEQIEIPNRIHRQPTDILRALSATVGHDPTAAHFKYHDDPFLTPMTNMTKRTYAMAQESGRKAARWIRQEHRDLFQHSVAQPSIKAFTPQMVFDENSEVDENCLRNLIRDAEVKDAIFVYKLMKTKNQAITDQLKQDLLELICFHNHEDAIPSDYIEERWFKQGTTGRERQRKTWKDGELADEIFNEIEPKSTECYAALIRGMCKYYQVERAWHLFQEAKEKNFQLDTRTYNAIISIISYLKESGELRWELCKDLLEEMKNVKLKPNLGTLNAILTTISTIGNYPLARSSLLKTLSEFKSLDIEPCLATWYYVLITLCRERGPVSHVLIDILKHIEGKEFNEIHDIKDTYFFVTAMDVCRNHLHDKNLAKRIDKLLHIGNNYNFIGDSYKESIYYRHYFALLCQTEPIDEFFNQTYDVLVPNIYIPEPGIMEELLKAIDTNGAIEMIPRIWSDMVQFDHIHRESLINRILKIMTTNKPDLQNPKEMELSEKFSIIAWDIFTRIDEQTTANINNENERMTINRNVRAGNSRFNNQKFNFTGQMLGEILCLITRAKNYENAVQVFNKLNKNQHQIPGVPTTDTIMEFIDLCIDEKQPSTAINCIEYCTENSLITNTNELVKKIKNGFTLNELHLTKLKNILGADGGDMDSIKLKQK